MPAGGNGPLIVAQTILLILLLQVTHFLARSLISLHVFAASPATGYQMHEDHDLFQITVSYFMIFFFLFFSTDFFLISKSLVSNLTFQLKQLLIVTEHHGTIAL